MRRKLTLAILVLSAALAGACRESADPEPAALETEEVSAPVDAAVTTAYDVRARSTEEIVGASLPGDFPGDVPLYGSASLINYGPAAPDRSFIELSVPAQPTVVERRYRDQLEAAGWRPGEGGAFVRGDRTIVVSYRQGTPGTWVRIEYPA